MNSIKTRYFCKFLLLFMLLVATAKGQSTHQIMGTVTDLDGKEVQATIRYVGGSLAVLNKQFTINLQNLPDTIKITAFNYKTIVRVVHNTKPLVIRMTPLSEQIEEVVIQTGYQSLKPNEVNGSVSVITQEMIQSRVGGNILDRIVGHSSGVLQSIGKSKNDLGITIRGLGTISGPLEPLIILDGYIYEGDIRNINPADVANVSILKDASAASIWGARAGNGVIVITTKRGRIEQPLQVNFQTSQVFSTAPDYAKNSWIGASEHIEIEKILFDKGYFDNQLQRSPYAAMTPVVEVLHAVRSKTISQEEGDRRLAYLSSQDARKAYKNEFYTTAHAQQYSLQLSGGSKRQTYSLTGNYDRSKGISRSVTDRFNFRLSNQFLITDRLSVNTGANFVLDRFLKTGAPVYGGIKLAGRSADYLTFRDEQGNPIHLDLSYRGAYTDTAANGLLLDWKFYPHSNYKHYENNQKREDLFANVSVKYQVFDFLDVTASYQHHLQRNDNETIALPDSYEARDLVNRYSIMNWKSNTLSYQVPVGGIQRSSYDAKSGQTWRIQTNADKLFGFHAVKAILGVEARHSGEFSHSNASRYGYNADPLTYTQINVLDYYRDFFTGSMYQIGSPNTLIKQQRRFLSYYGNLSYSYLGKYILSASARKDGSNLFGVTTNDRWKPLWSTGLGWKLSEESFYHSNAIPEMRLTGTFGYSGNVDFTRTALPTIGYGVNRETQLRYARIIYINNPSLKWEQLAQWSLRWDFATVGNRIHGSVGAFIKRGSDLYGDAPYDYTGWGKMLTVTRNVSDMRGRGVEVDLHSKNINTNNLKWNSSFYFNWNDNKTVNHYSKGSRPPLSSLMGGGNVINPVEGWPLYTYVGYKWGGLDEKGDPQGFLDGKLSTDYKAMRTEASNLGTNLVYMGSASPTYYGSLINSFSFQNISLSFNINYRLGYVVRKNSISYGQLISNGTAHVDYLKRWQKPGDELQTNIPAFQYPNNPDRDSFYLTSEANIISGDHVRLDYVNIHYKIPTSQWRKPFHQLELTGGMQHLGVVWRKNKDGIDPDQLNFSTPQLYSIRLNLTF